MEYKYGKNDNYEDFSAGRVLYSIKGDKLPSKISTGNIREVLTALTKKNNICLYDCCCGGGYLLTVLGF